MSSSQKDADGDYWLFIQGGDLKAACRLDAGEEGDSISRGALDAWLGRSRQQEPRQSIGMRPNGTPVVSSGTSSRPNVCGSTPI
jgi:hypothetical protein